MQPEPSSTEVNEWPWAASCEAAIISFTMNLHPSFLVLKASGQARTGNVYFHGLTGPTPSMTSATLPPSPTATVLLALPACTAYNSVSAVSTVQPWPYARQCFLHMVATSCKLCEVGSSNMMHILYATASSLESESLFRLHRLYMVLTHLSSQHMKM